MNYVQGRMIEKLQATVEMRFTDGELALTFDDGSKSLFEPLQLHFHSPSEHTIDGQHLDLEMHIVHVHKEDHSLGSVISVLFERETNENVDNHEFFRSLQIDKADEPGYQLTNVRLADFLDNLDFN